MSTNAGAPRIAVIVPCYNEELAIGSVVRDMRLALPSAFIYVYDNNSSDRTCEVAAAAGAIVRRENRQGKGNVIRRALADVDADVYLMIDGDDTYDASAAPDLVDAVIHGHFDMVTGVRKAVEDGAYRAGHENGNKAFNAIVSNIFGYQVSDMLSGYRAFSRRFVKSFPALSRTFEIETELTVHAINNRMPQLEIPVAFKDRPVGSESKLRTYHDGFKILKMITALVHHERPFVVYAMLASLFVLAATVIAFPLTLDFAQTGHLPSPGWAVMGSFLMLLATLLLVIGMILAGQLRLRKHLSRIAYLGMAAPAPYLAERGLDVVADAEAITAGAIGRLPRQLQSRAADLGIA